MSATLTRRSACGTNRVLSAIRMFENVRSTYGRPLFEGDSGQCKLTARDQLTEGL
jgi:hypothetical protein